MLSNVFVINEYCIFSMKFEFDNRTGGIFWKYVTPFNDSAFQIFYLRLFDIYKIRFICYINKFV